MELASNPERFQIGHGAAAAKVAEKLGPTKHGCDFANGFFFHGGAGAAAVERVIVGIDEHGKSVGQASDWMRRFEHLPGVERMEIGIVFLEARSGFVKNFGESGRDSGRSSCRKIRKTLRKSFGGVLENFQRGGVERELIF